MPDVEKLTAEVLALPDAQRVALAHRVLDSLEDSSEPDDEYSRELNRRQTRVRAGTAVIRDWSEVEAVIERLRSRNH